MSECIAMVIGFVLGAGCVILAQASGKLSAGSDKRAEQSPAPTTIAKENVSERAQLQKQWENFLNYDGTTKGQVEIGGDE